MAAALTVTLMRDVGKALLVKGDWRHPVPLSSLPQWLALYRRLWARGAKSKDNSKPGPWAAFYEADVQALAAAVREVQNG